MKRRKVVTAQIPDTLKNNHPKVDFGNLSIQAVVIGDITKEHGWGVGFYKMPILPNPPKGRTCSALWSGYIKNFELLETGQLKLVSYSYPFADTKERPIDEVNLLLEGNFWLVMKSDFEGPKVFVPFVDGFIETDYNQWQVQNGESLTKVKENPDDGMTGFAIM